MKVEEFDGVVLSRSWQTYMPLIKQKSHCIRAANPNDIGVAVMTKSGLKFRIFSVEEMEKMQTLPIGYTSTKGVSVRQQKACIGNGWTVDVIVHILKYLAESEGEK